MVFAAILPQFVDRSGGSVTARVRTAVVGHPRRLRNVTRVGGASMSGLGVLTAVTGRHR